MDKVALKSEISRNVNCLVDDNRMVRRKALESLQKLFCVTDNNMRPAEDIELDNNLYDTLWPNLTKCLVDPVEKHREISVSILRRLLERIDAHNADKCIAYLIPALNKRLGQKEVLESSEEVRLQEAELILLIIEKMAAGDRLVVYLDELTSTLVKLIIDTFPEVRKAACRCTSRLARAIPRQFHVQSESFTKPLLSSIAHQHAKVRCDVLKCIKNVVLHGNGKIVDDVSSHVAQRLFDQSPLVRTQAVKCVGKWLIDLPDRYSYFHKLIPLLLTGLCDEVPEVRRLTLALWTDAGAKFASENENDLKDKLDFGEAIDSASLRFPPISVDSFEPMQDLEEAELLEPDPERSSASSGATLSRFNLGCRTLVQRNVHRVLPALVNDLSDWLLQTRVKSAQLLVFIVLNAESGVTQHTVDLLNGTAKASLDEDVNVRTHARRALEYASRFVRTGTWSQLLIPAIKNGHQLLGNLFNLSALVRGCSTRDFFSVGQTTAPEGQSESNGTLGTLLATQVFDVLILEDVSCSSAVDQQQRVLDCIESVVHHFRKLNQLPLNANPEGSDSASAIDFADVRVDAHSVTSYRFSLFSVLLNLLSAASSESVRSRAVGLLESISSIRVFGVRDVAQLYAIHCRTLLARLADSCRAQQFASVAHRRALFETILLELGARVPSLLSDVDVINSAECVFVTTCSTDRDAELRSRSLTLLAKFITHLHPHEVMDTDADMSVELKSRLGLFVETVLKQVVLPNLSWKAGRPNAAARTCAITCLFTVLQNAKIVSSYVSRLGSLSIADREKLSVPASASSETANSSSNASAHGTVLELFTVLKSVSEDDVKSTRLFAARSLRQFLVHFGEFVPDRELLNAYPTFLKRLDDADDEIRVAATRMLRAYFAELTRRSAVQPELVGNFTQHVDEMLAGVLVHLDDSNTAVQEAVLDCLKDAANFASAKLRTQVDKVRSVHRSTTYCDQLIKHIDTIKLSD